MTISPDTIALETDAAPRGRAGGQCARHPERAVALQCTRCGDNLCDDCARERVDGVCKSCLDLLSTRGRVWQVQWLAVVTIVHGCLLLFWGVGLMLSGVFLGYSIHDVEPTRVDAPPTELLAGMFAGMTLLMMLGQIVPGVLQVAAGYYMLSFRYRWLAVAAYVSGLLSISGCYCLPTSIALGAWGLFLVIDRDVAARYAARAA